MAFDISLNTFLAAKTNQNEKKIAPPSVVCHGLPENAFQVNQLYNVTWSIVHHGVNNIALFVYSRTFGLQYIILLILVRFGSVGSSLISNFSLYVPIRHIWVMEMFN